MTAVRSRRTSGLLQIVIIVLVLVTAVIHLQRGIGMSVGGPPGSGSAGPLGPGGGSPGGAPGGFNIMRALPIPLPTLFLLNGIGYLLLVLALYLPTLHRVQRITRWVLILFTAVTIIMYFLVVGTRPNPIGIFDKSVEALLIILLLVEDRQRRPSAPASAV